LVGRKFRDIEDKIQKKWDKDASIKAHIAIQVI
jgi:hypothetical protein